MTAATVIQTVLHHRISYCMLPSASSGRVERWLDSAFATGTLTAIATGGALLGLGWREGEAGRVFRLAGRGLLERFGVVSAAAPLTSVALGYLHHLLVASLWGFVLSLLLLPLKGAIRYLGAGVLAMGYLVVASMVLPPALRIGHAVTSSIPSGVPIGAALALALMGGVWLDATQHEH
jgi:hypothetical protein